VRSPDARNAIARVASLVAIAAVGAVVAARFDSAVDAGVRTSASDPAATKALSRAKDKPLVVDAGEFPPRERASAHDALVSASVDGYRIGIGISAGLAFAAGLISIGGVRNLRREVSAESCPGGALCGASSELAR
jgi:hypothetical protein